MKNLLVCLALLLACTAPSPAEAETPPSAAEAARPVALRDIAATLHGKEMDAQHGHEDRSLGVDSLTACDAVVLNLGRMFVRTE